jgi:hypothetical protein
MISLDDMPVNDAIKLYYEKYNAIRQGDMNQLLVLKKKCPELFIKEKDEEIRVMLFCIQIIKDSPHYKELGRREAKAKFSVVES